MSKIDKLPIEFTHYDKKELPKLLAKKYKIDPRVGPSNWQVWERMQELDANHKIVLDHVTAVHDEHITKIIELHQLHAEVMRHIKELRRITKTETFDQRRDDMLLMMSEINKKLININESIND